MTETGERWGDHRPEDPFPTTHGPIRSTERQPHGADATVVWVDGNHLVLSISAPTGLVYQQMFPMAVLTAKMADEGEVVRFTFDLDDPEDGTTISGAGRILIQELSDPRTVKTAPDQ